MRLFLLHPPLIQLHAAALGQDRLDGGDAELDSFLQAEFHAVAARYALYQQGVQGRFAQNALRGFDRHAQAVLVAVPDAAGVFLIRCAEQSQLVAAAPTQHPQQMVGAFAADLHRLAGVQWRRPGQARDMRHQPRSLISTLELR